MTWPSSAPKKAKPRYSERRYPWYRYRGLLFLPPVVLLTFSFYGASDRLALNWPLGGAVFVAGFGLRVWAQMHLHYRLDIPKIVTTTGPYSYVRNPIYVGNTLILLSLCFLSGLLWFTPIMLAWCMIVYAHVVRYEESHLLKKYGQPYQDFLSRIPRWWPRSFKRQAAAADVWRLFLPSLMAEAYNLLYVVPFVLKELVLKKLLNPH